MARTEPIRLTVITPERQVLAVDTTSVVFAAHDGEVGILRDRAPLMCELGIGQLRYEAGGPTRRMFIDGGFAQVYENAVTVLTQRAVPAENVTAEMVAAAQQAVQQFKGTDPETQSARQQAQRRVSVLQGLRTGG